MTEVTAISAGGAILGAAGWMGLRGARPILHRVRALGVSRRAVAPGARAYLRRWSPANRRRLCSSCWRSTACTRPFSCAGKNVRRYPSIARLVAAAGHEIGNHTDSHPRLDFHTPELSTASFALGAGNHSSHHRRFATAVPAAVRRAMVWPPQRAGKAGAEWACYGP